MLRLTLCCALVVSAMSARADEDPQVAKARIHLRAGMADYDEGRYAEAAAEMEQAYALKPVPDLQYNLGQCYDRAGRLEDAARAYEGYLAGRPEAPEAEVVRKRIVNLRERAKAQAEGRTDVGTMAQGKVVFKTLVVYREVPAPPGRAARAAAYGLGVLGLAGIATGITFVVLTVQASNAVTNGGDVKNPVVFQNAKQDQARLYPIGTGVGFGIGALAIGGAIGLYAYSRKIDKEAARAREHDEARIPTITPFYAKSPFGSTSGIAVAGSF